ncbi:MAG: class I SAM-dependent methyltransferase [Vicingaceae bacterium]
MHPQIHKTSSSTTSFVSNTLGLDYELIDCGNQRKLERFGTNILNRPEIEAKWTPKLPQVEWEKADWYFYEKKGKKGEWRANGSPQKSWNINYQVEAVSLQFKLELTAFKHIGLFPEQAANWHYIQENLRKIKGDKKVLNLFAYTGAASLVCAASGAKVTNIDSVKQVLNWGRENAKINQIDNIRWILEDARKYVKKAVRRGEKYHGIILDPPAFGYGAKKERWKLEEDLLPLLQDLATIMYEQSSFLILNTYSPKISLHELEKMVQSVKGFPSGFELSQLGLRSSKEVALSLGNLVRFQKLNFK